MRNYFIPKNTLLIKNEKRDFLKSLDTIVFDIDGVLINVKHSFRETSCQTVEFYLSKFLGFKKDLKRLVEIEDTEFFKLAGGFNDDWDVSSAITLFYLWLARKYRTKSFKELRKYRDYLPSFTKKVKQMGGGLKNTMKIVKEIFSNAELLKIYDREIIKQIFKEIYAGEDVFKVYRVKEKYHCGEEGLYYKEKLIIKREVPKNFKYGIITGRTEGEMKLALKLLSWKKFKRKFIICADDGLKKPNPKALIELLKNLKTKVGIYVGDNLDDLTLVKNYLKIRKNPHFLSSIVLSGPSGEKNKDVFLKSGVDLIAKDVNILLNYLEEEKCKKLN